MRTARRPRSDVCGVARSRGISPRRGSGSARMPNHFGPGRRRCSHGRAAATGRPAAAGSSPAARRAGLPPGGRRHRRSGRRARRTGVDRPGRGRPARDGPRRGDARVQRGRVARRRLRAGADCRRRAGRHRRGLGRRARCSPSRCAATCPTTATWSPTASSRPTRTPSRARSPSSSATASSWPAGPRRRGRRPTRSSRPRCRSPAWIGFAGLALAIGVPVLALLCWPAGWASRPAAPAGDVGRGRGRRGRRRCSFLLQGPYAAGAGLGSVLDPSLLAATAVVRPPAGRCSRGPSWPWPWRAVLRPAWRRGAPPSAARSCAPAGVLARRARRGHGGDRPRRSPGRGRASRWPSTAVHVAAMAVWLGGLAGLLAGRAAAADAPRPTSPRRCRRFSRVAFGAVVGAGRHRHRAGGARGGIADGAVRPPPTAGSARPSWPWSLVAAGGGRGLPGLGAAAARRPPARRPARRRQVTAHAFAAPAAGRRRGGRTGRPVRDRARCSRRAPSSTCPRCAARCSSRSPSPPSSWRSPPSWSAPRRRASAVAQPVDVMLPLQGTAGAVGQRAGVGGPRPSRAPTRCTSTSSTTTAGRPSRRRSRVTLTEPSQEIGPLDVELAAGRTRPLRRRRDDHPRRRHLDARRHRPPRRVHRHHGAAPISRCADRRSPHPPTHPDEQEFRVPAPPPRPGAVVVAALTALAACVAVATARVRARDGLLADAAPGGFGKLTFRVPNESDTASTVGLRIQIPEEAALASLRTQPVPGLDGDADHLRPRASRSRPTAQEISQLRLGRRVPRRRRRRHRAGRVPGVRAVRRRRSRTPTSSPSRRCRSTATAPRRPGSSRRSTARRSRSARRRC